jgi:hypothetical protein
MEKERWEGKRGESNGRRWVSGGKHPRISHPTTPSTRFPRYAGSPSIPTFSGVAFPTHRAPLGGRGGERHSPRMQGEGKRGGSGEKRTLWRSRDFDPGLSLSLISVNPPPLEHSGSPTRARARFTQKKEMGEKGRKTGLVGGRREERKMGRKKGWKEDTKHGRKQVSRKERKGRKRNEGMKEDRK